MSLAPATTQTLRTALATAVAVPVTPLHADGTPDWDTYARLIGRLADAGITIITPNGNTGEFYALDQAEARQATQTAAQAVRGRQPAELLVGVGHDIATATEAARHAGDHGARMIMIHQPVHPYVSAQGWIDYHVAIANAVPDLGVVLVHQGRAAHRRAHRRTRGPGPERHRRQVRRPGRDQVRRRGPGRRDRPAHLAGRCRRADRAGLLGGRRPGVHLGPGERRARPRAGHVRRAARGRLRGRHEGLGHGAQVRGAAPGGLLGGQRERGQGGPGPARPLPARTSARPAAPSRRPSGRRSRGILATWDIG